jgi:hypothetical protein
MFKTAREDLQQVVVDGLSRSGLEFLVEQLSSLESVVTARKLDAMTAIDRLNDGGVDSATVARTRGKASSKKAKKAANTAKKLAEMPKTRKKLADGDISEEHADAAADAAETVGDAQKADEALSGSAGDQPADLFGRRAREWAEKNRPDDGSDERSRHRRNRHLRQFTAKDDGSFGLSGTTDKVEGRELWNLIEEEADRLWRDDGGREVDIAGSRTGAQRRWDALVGLVKKGAGCAAGIAGSGSVKAPHPKYQGLALIPIETLLPGPAGEARAELVGSGPIPLTLLERMLCDASIAPMIVGRDGQPLWMGDSIRTATSAQWRALIMRDQGCVVCGADPSRCEAHHVVFWNHDGPTDITNLVLLCSHHHHQLHDHNLELVSKAGVTKLMPRAGPAQPPRADGSARPHRHRTRTAKQPAAP